AAGGQQQGAAGRDSAEGGPGDAVGGVLPGTTPHGGGDGDTGGGGGIRVRIGDTGQDGGHGHVAAGGVLVGRGDHVRTAAEGRCIVGRDQGDDARGVHRESVLPAVGGAAAVTHIAQGDDAR